MKGHDDRQRSDRLVVTQPVHPATPPLLRTEKQLTAPADRSVRDPAHAVAFTTAVAVGGAGSVHRRTGMRTARALPADRNGAGSPPATNCEGTLCPKSRTTAPGSCLRYDAKAVQGIGMAHSGRWRPVVDQTAHPLPGKPGLLTAPPHRPCPEPTNPEAEQAECVGVHGHPVVAQVPTHNRAQPASHLRDRIVRPGRSQHNALDALYVGLLTRRRVLLARIPFGQAPSLHPLRGPVAAGRRGGRFSLGCIRRFRLRARVGCTIAAPPAAAPVLVRGFPRYYGPVRLPSSVHRRRPSLDFPTRPAAPSATGEAGISRLPRKVFPYVPGVCDRAGSRGALRYRRPECGLPHPPTASAPRSNPFRGSIPGPHVPLSTLHPRSCERRRMTQGRRGSLQQPCRFLPAHRR